jgi:exopolysaccharide biosynthesis polyprenyl glycosylphosphotransferase
MMRRDRQIRIQVHQWMDGMVFALGLWLAHFIRFNWDLIVKGFRNVVGLKELAHVVRYDMLGVPIADKPYNPDPVAPFSEYMPLIWVLIPMAMFLLENQGFYERPLFAPRRKKAWQLAKTSFLSTIGLILVVYLVRAPGVARGVIVLFGFCSFGLMSLKEELVIRWWRSKLVAEQLTRRVLLVGEAAETEKLWADMRKEQPDLEVMGEMDLNRTSTGELIGFLHEHCVNNVVFSARRTVFGRIEEAIQACELEGVEAWLVADFFQTRISQTTLDELCGRPMLVFRSGPQLASWAGVIKQLIDVAGALFLLVALSPIMLGAALILKLTSRGPVFFRQKRAGLNGRPFTMYKFRSMVTNAEQLKQELASLNEMSGPVFKVTNDPRVTQFGRLLRKYSVDEFPQLFNVLLGQMSLVGPRPLPVEEVNRFDDWAHRRRLSVKPGLTCLWQVGGRSEVRDFKEWVRLDLEYIDHWSLWLDIKILWRTIPVVLLGRGAR